MIRYERIITNEEEIEAKDMAVCSTVISRFWATRAIPSNSEIPVPVLVLITVLK